MSSASASAAEKVFTPAERCKAAATNLYMNGSDARQQKNGNPNKLFDKCMNAPTIATVGVYKHYLSEEERRIIVDEDRRLCLSQDFITKMCIAILRAEADSVEYKTEREMKVYVNIPTSKQRTMIEAGAKGKFDIYKDKEVEKYLSPKRMFIHQERQKVNDN